jgi:hypothetical protein
MCASWAETVAGLTVFGATIAIVLLLQFSAGSRDVGIIKTDQRITDDGVTPNTTDRGRDEDARFCSRIGHRAHANSS